MGWDKEFQSTRPRGARRYLPRRQPRMVAGFNPRAREGRDGGGESAPVEVVVSIHAPARGATSKGFQNAIAGVFQSTRPRGARPSRVAMAFASNAVSIHAPARGATARRRSLLISALFQSTRPRGARPFSGLPLKFFFLFQSTRPRGARRVSVCCFGVIRAFQSTRPRGARQQLIRLFRLALVAFQSTRPRGARRRAH